MQRRRVLVGPSALLLALVACEPQAVRLFSDAQVAVDAGAPPPVIDANVPPPPPPPALEQPECRSDACRRCIAEPCVVAGAQWLCHPVTGECALPCEPVSDSSQCPREQTCHPDFAVCVDCVGNAECGAAAPACDTQRNECVECVSEAACSAPTPACDTIAQRCVTCLEDRHCGAGLVCDRGNQRCVQCFEDEHCAGVGVGDDLQPRCDTQRNVCVECLGDADCTSDPDKPFCKLSEFECDDERD